MTATEQDFAAIKAQARFDIVLARYGLETTGQGAERMIRCPFHDDRTPSCAINLDKKLFHCFACGAQGTILDFIALMDSCSIVDVVNLLADWGYIAKPAGVAKGQAQQGSGNVPLTFTLQLDPHHPYLRARGVSEETVARFGLGFCDRGIMKGRICVPIHDEHGRLVAYVGRWAVSVPPSRTPRYLFPRGFRKGQVLFNLHRVVDATHLVVVEGFWSVLRLDALGMAAVALMGCTLSKPQEALLRSSRADRLTLLLDGDEAGRTASADILPRLARHHFVHAPDLPAGTEPDILDEQTLKAAIKPAAHR
jgi:DNA primase